MCGGVHTLGVHGGCMHWVCMGGACTGCAWGVHALGVPGCSDWLWWGHLTNQKLARRAWGMHTPGVHGGVHTPGMHRGPCTGHAWGVHTPGMCGGSTHQACVGDVIGCGGDT